jgi:hypothetical protein
VGSDDSISIKYKHRWTVTWHTPTKQVLGRGHRNQCAGRTFPETIDNNYRVLGIGSEYHIYAASFWGSGIKQ